MSVPTNYAKTASEEGLVVTNTYHKPVVINESKDVEVLQLPSTGSNDNGLVILSVILTGLGIIFVMYRRYHHTKK